jgi:hypothetical protein
MKNTIARIQFQLRIAVEIVLAIILLVVAIIAGNRLEPYQAQAKPEQSPIVLNSEEVKVESYLFGKTQPINFGSVVDPNFAYVHFKFNFRVDSHEGHPNVFQTAPLNRGIRMEIAGSTAGLIFPDLNAPNGLRGLTLTSDLKKGQWYSLEVEGLNTSYVRAKLDGQEVANFDGESFSMSTSELVVGGGFDTTRPFRGEINNISVTKGNLPVSFSKFDTFRPQITFPQLILIFFCVIVFYILSPYNIKNSPIKSSER